jgi:uroporphyrin-3 C-methyltransferase/uroporphyrinogen III methyltransferase/synthase
MDHASPSPLTDPPLRAEATTSGSPLVVRRRAAPAAFWIAIVALVLGAAGLALAIASHNRLETVERELARRIQGVDGVSNEARIAAKQAQDIAIALQTREGVLESKVADSQSQQASLQQLYQDLSRTRDDWALAEVEQLLSVGSQQLQLAGNVPGALIALQNADDRLARADRPQFIALRRVIARDMDRLRALPSVDLAGDALRLDSLVSMVDKLPLLSDERASPAPRLDAVPIDREPRNPPRAGAASSAAPTFLERMSDDFRYLGAETWQQFQQLVRVREVNEPDALLLAPSQAYFVRENLKLRLLNARLALLAHQEPIFRADLLRVDELLRTYFDSRAQSTVAALALLKQIEGSTTAIEMPTLADSLNAVRSFKSAGEHP